MAGRLVVVVTSPRLPAGMLTAAGWRAVEGADVVVASTPDDPLVAALTAAGVAVSLIPGAGADELLALAAASVVAFLPSSEAVDQLTHELAEVVVRRSGVGSSDPEIEVVVGSFDPVGARLLDAVEAMDVLRARCPWDRKQTHESLLPYLVEETYEVIEAIENDAADQLCEELGDLLLQVLFHSQIAGERAEDAFTVDDVAGQLVDKLVRRHPHVFAGADAPDAAAVESAWDEIKRAEKSRSSVLEGIPAGLPALSLADSVLRRSGMPGEDGAPGDRYTEEALGDALFALVAAARVSGVDAEQALRRRVRAEIAVIRAAERHAAPSAAQPRR